MADNMNRGPGMNGNMPPMNGRPPMGGKMPPMNGQPPMPPGGKPGGRPGDKNKELSADELRDLNIDGTRAHTRHVFAVQTALCLVDCRFFIITERDLVKIARTDMRLLCRHRILFR